MTGSSRLIDKYLFSESRRLLVGLTGLILVILLIERLIRIVELVANSENGGVASFRMVLDLVPHYLELAIPAALLLSMIISIDRVSRSGELVSMLAAGLSLKRLLLPFVVLSALAAAASLLLSGILQPLTRYDYRLTINDIQTESLRAAFQEGRFVQLNDYTVWTDYRDFSGRSLGETFILEQRPDGSERYISAPSGEMLENSAGEVALLLNDGRGATLQGAAESNKSQIVQFDQMTWPLASQSSAFRPRGKDERELMLHELLDTSTHPEVEQRVAYAAFNDRISRTIINLALPLLAFALGLNLGRRPKTGGIVFGIIALLVVQKAFEYGLQMASVGTIPVWAGSWPIVIVTTIGGIVLFSRAAGEALITWPGSRPQVEAVRNDDLAFADGGRS